MPRAPLIDADLCVRLRRFDPQCEISMVRTSPMNGSEWEYARRVWVVCIRKSSSQNISDLWDAIRCIHPTLREALTRAVEEGERRGWARA